MQNTEVISGKVPFSLRWIAATDLICRKQEVNAFHVVKQDWWPRRRIEQFATAAGHMNEIKQPYMNGYY